MSTMEAEKQILVMSINTRKVHKMHAGHLNQHAPSKEYIPVSYNKIYGVALAVGMKWTVKQAAHFLVGENPDDHHWLPDARNYVSADYQKMYKSINDAYMLGNIELQEQRQVDGQVLLVAENIEFIRWAIERDRSNLPEVLIDFFNQSRPVATILVKDKVKITSAKRTNALHQLIWPIVQENTDKSAQELWNILKNSEDEAWLIHKIDPWTSSNPKIHWTTPNRIEKTLSTKAFKNLISEMRNNPEKFCPG